jgi:plastocyanin
MIARATALALLLALAPAAVGAATFSDALAQPGVVWLSGGPLPTFDDPLQVRQTGRTFVPDLLVVPLGASVAFPNDDPYYHSVFSSSPNDPFDLGLYDKGPGKVLTFTATGAVEVRCHIHASMRATVIVVDGPFARTTQPGERYHFDNIRPGRRTLHEWTLATGETTRTIVVRP